MQRLLNVRFPQFLIPLARITRVAMAVALVGLVVTSCKGSDDPGVLSTLVIAPSSPTVAAAGTVQFTASGTDFTGAAVVPNAGVVVWSVAAGGGTIDPKTGLFTAGTKPGTYTNTIVATCRGISATTSVTVTAAALATITVTPNVTLAIGATQTFTATGADAFGNAVVINPTWTAVAGGTIPASSTGTTVVYTAGNTPGTYNGAIKATQGTISGTANVIVIAGPVATITVTPNPATLAVGATQVFTAVGTDAGGNVVAINPTWTVINGGGTIPAGTTGQTATFTATTSGTFTNTVQAAQGAVSGTATVIVTAPPPPVVTLPPAIPPTVAAFTMIARVAWTCTNGSIVGDIGTNQTASEVPPGAITQTLCPITGGTPQLGTAAAKQAYSDFLVAYTARQNTACGTTLTGTLAGVILAPGVYCFDAAATLTGTLTLAGPSTGVWLFKIGQTGIGALTGTNFNVVMAGGASGCNVTWWVRDGSTMTTSNFRGAILAGAGVSFSGGTFKGSAYSQQDVTVTGTPVTACSSP